MVSGTLGDSVKAWEQEQWGKPMCMEEQEKSAQHF